MREDGPAGASSFGIANAGWCDIERDLAAEEGDGVVAGGRERLHSAVVVVALTREPIAVVATLGVDGAHVPVRVSRGR